MELCGAAQVHHSGSIPKQCKYFQRRTIQEVFNHRRNMEEMPFFVRCMCFREFWYLPSFHYPFISTVSFGQVELWSVSQAHCPSSIPESFKNFEQRTNSRALQSSTQHGSDVFCVRCFLFRRAFLYTYVLLIKDRATPCRRLKCSISERYE